MAHVRNLLAMFALCLVIAVPVFAQQSRVCEDRDERCNKWALKGECYKNRGFMYVYCPRTCGQCVVSDHRCKDIDIMCPGWAERQECRRNKPYMEKMCARSCAFCTPANDHGVPHVHSNVVDRAWKAWNKKNPSLG